MPQNHQKHNFLTFLHPDKLRCPKDHMTESKYSKRSPLLSTNLVQIVMWSVRHQEIDDQSSYFFYGCNFSEVIWHSVQMTIFLNTEYNNILSSIYTWNKIKLPCDLFPEWLYTVAKSSKLQKSCTEKNASYIHIEIFIYWCPKGHRRKSDN